MRRDDWKSIDIQTNPPGFVLSNASYCCLFPFCCILPVEREQKNIKNFCWLGWGCLCLTKKKIGELRGLWLTMLWWLGHIYCEWFLFNGQNCCSLHIVLLRMHCSRSRSYWDQVWRVLLSLGHYFGMNTVGAPCERCSGNSEAISGVIPGPLI